MLLIANIFYFIVDVLYVLSNMFKALAQKCPVLGVHLIAGRYYATLKSAVEE